jgi:hypothetical protein
MLPVAGALSAALTPFQGFEDLADLLQQLDLLSGRGDGHVYTAFCQQNVCENAFWFLMEVKEVATIEKKHGGTDFLERRMCAEHV